jgi:catechol 2,3-dioxygenase
VRAYVILANMVDTATNARLLGAATALGAVHLNVSDLDRSLGFYTTALGLQVQRRDGATAASGAGADELLVLHELPGASRPQRHSGLYHYAILLPSRPELAHALVRLLAQRRPIQGASDHGFSEAIYLADPDGNGIELYSDRPREAWPPLEDAAAVAPAPLNVESLLAEAHGEDPKERAPADTGIGHIHLHVGDLDAAVRFYRDVVGFDLIMRMGPSAAFLSAGGYHHHIGLNTWAGEGAPPTPADAVGLREFTLLVADRAELAAVRLRAERAGLAPAGEAESLTLPEPSGSTLRIAVS